MQQVQIKFTARGGSTAIGDFGPGDLLRCSPDLARHFVEQLGCARYADDVAAPRKAPSAQIARPAARVRRVPGATPLTPPTE